MHIKVEYMHSPRILAGVPKFTSKTEMEDAQSTGKIVASHLDGEVGQRQISWPNTANRIIMKTKRRTMTQMIATEVVAAATIVRAKVRAMMMMTI